MTIGWAGKLRLLKDYTAQQIDQIARLVGLREATVARRRHPLVTFPAPPDPWISEAAFQILIVDLLEACGWWVHHETDSRRSEHGFPDLWAVRPPRLMAIELKTTKGAPDLPQLWWMEDLLRCAGDTFAYHLWTPRPEDWPKILMAIAPANTVFDPLNTVLYLTRQGPEHDRKPPPRRR